jgi:hypothetical protein
MRGVTFWLLYFAPISIAWYRVRQGKPVVNSLRQVFPLAAVGATGTPPTGRAWCSAAQDLSRMYQQRTPSLHLLRWLRPCCCDFITLTRAVKLWRSAMLP